MNYKNMIRRLLVYWSVASNFLVLSRLASSHLRGLQVPCNSEISSTMEDRRTEKVTVIVPTYNEQARLAPCLEGLLRQSSVVKEILVVDNGSSDRTPALVEAYAARDSRVRLLEVGPPPHGWNGKSWALWNAANAVSSETNWLLVIDADVRPAPTLADRLVSAAQLCGVPALSIAVQQMPGFDFGSWLLHPAFLATVIYRVGLPGRIDKAVDTAFLNGQVFLLHRSLLSTLDSFRAVAFANAEDIAIARLLARAGYPIAFLPSLDDSFVLAYPDAVTLWTSWPRSLPMQDGFGTLRTLIDHAILVGSQGLWLPLLILSWRVPRIFVAASFGMILRWGLLIGMRTAYQQLSPWYWLSPLCDPLVIARVLMATGKHSLRWRDRVITRRRLV